MKIGIVKEIKNNEFRVSCIPSDVSALVSNNNEVFIEHNAGIKSGFLDEDYIKAGAQIEKNSNDVWNKVDLIYKVKEILPEEFKYLRKNLIIFAFLHSNAHREETTELLKNNCISIAYEDILDKKGNRPILAVMSELAGKGAFLEALHLSSSLNQGSGKLLSNICGVQTPIITILGYGNSGFGACELACKFGNRVNILGRNIEKMKAIKNLMPDNVNFLISNRENILKCLKESDVIINCVLWDILRKDHLIYAADLKLMKKNSIIIDVSCDEKGAIETSRPTSLENPTYYVNDILHYCVDNIPSIFSQTSSIILSNITLPYILDVTNNGIKKALKSNGFLRKGLTTFEGHLTLYKTAKKLNIIYSDANNLI